MKKLDEIAFVVQARLGSQRVPRKMIKTFSGTTLMDIIIKKMRTSSYIPYEQFYVSAYEEELKSICKKYDANIFHRSEESANSEGTPMTQMYEWWNKLPYKYCILINACAPFLNVETIEDFTKAYLETEADGLFGVIEKKNYFWNQEGALVTPWPEGQAVMNTKFVEKTNEAAHCLYAGRMDRIGDGIWMGDFSVQNDISLFPMQEREVLDIDYDWEFEMCELLYKGGLR
jgi:CMP-N-acetylneuraminic acid synthetase